MEPNGFGNLQNRKGRWQDYHFLRKGNLATLKGAIMANVQISQDLFMKLARYHLLDDLTLGEEIKKELNSKIERLIDRQIYTESKMGTSKEDRENARREYLERKGIPESFRW